MVWLEQLYDREYDGEMLWNALVRRHPGIFLVLCGHVGGSGTGQLASRGDGGNLVEQVLANFNCSTRAASVTCDCSKSSRTPLDAHEDIFPVAGHCSRPATSSGQVCRSSPRLW
jgi:hypothetical protein